MRVRVRERERQCVYVCVSEREKGRECEREGEREREKRMVVSIRLNPTNVPNSCDTIDYVFIQLGVVRSKPFD
jgi:hypothetical protein